MALTENGETCRRCRRGDRPALRPRRAFAKARASVLVSVLRRPDGPGLALVRNHHQHGLGAQAGFGGQAVEGGRPRLRWARQSLSKHAAGAARNWRRTGVDGERLGEISRLVAKVDSAAVQDGFAIYLHTFVVSDDGAWTVIQQGMNAATRLARRYHWLSEGLSSFVEAPHSAIDGQPVGNILNLTDRRAARAREIDAELARGDPDRVLLELRKLLQTRQPNLFANEAHLRMPAHHDVWPTDVSLKRLRGNLAAAANRGPRDFTELL